MKPLDLSHLPHEEQVASILTASDEAQVSAWARRSVSRRKQSAGKPKVLRPCPHCGEMLGARTMRKHVPGCTARG